MSLLKFNNWMAKDMSLLEFNNWMAKEMSLLKFNKWMVKEMSLLKVNNWMAKEMSLLKFVYYKKLSIPNYIVHWGRRKDLPSISATITFLREKSGVSVDESKGLICSIWRCYWWIHFYVNKYWEKWKCVMRHFVCSKWKRYEQPKIRT